MELTQEQKANNTDTYEHIHKVHEAVAKFQEVLSNRAINHDRSKLSSPEVEKFTEFTINISKTEYGTPEYTEGIKSLGPALSHHYANNSHHPEHHENGIDGMNLADLVEMLCDWYASCMRYKNGDIYRSLEINKERFGISDQLYNILKNTVPLIREK